MLLKNNSKRLISINEPLDVVKDKDGFVSSAAGGASHDLMPAGEAVNVPDSLCDSKYVKALIDCGAILVTEDDGAEGEDDEYNLDKMTKAELVSFAEENKIEIDDSKRKADVLADIEAAIS